MSVAQRHDRCHVDVRRHGLSCVVEGQTLKRGFQTLERQFFETLRDIEYQKRLFCENRVISRVFLDGRIDLLSCGRVARFEFGLHDQQLY